MLRHVWAWNVGHHQEARTFLARAAYASSYVVGIVHIIQIIIIIIIIIIEIKSYSSSKQYYG